MTTAAPALSLGKLRKPLSFTKESGFLTPGGMPRLPRAAANNVYSPKVPMARAISYAALVALVMFLGAMQSPRV